MCRRLLETVGARWYNSYEGSIEPLFVSQWSRESAEVTMARSATRRPAPALRLTRRGRLVVLCAFIALAGGAGALVATSSGAAPAAADAPVTVVRPNDTLWRIATREFPDHDP